MAQSDARARLVRFLDQKAFQPVLTADTDRFPEGQREKLLDLKQRTRVEIERFRSYSSAHDVVVNFHRDLSSAPAKKVHRELRELGLPTIEELRDDFENLAEELEIS
jgi:hypothetical protein